MSTKLSGFVEIPILDGRIAYIRVASIDAVFFGIRYTLIQLHGCSNSDHAFNTDLALDKVLSLIDEAQNG